MDFITHVGEGLKASLTEMVKRYQGLLEAGSLSEMEVAIRQMTYEVGHAVMQQWLEAQDEKYPAGEQPCRCGEQAVYVRRREGMTLTLQGRVYYRRAYYLCRHCGWGQYPLDERLGIQPGEMSEQVVRQAALVGVQDAFETGSQTLAELTLLALSPNSIRKASQEIGERVLTREQQQRQRSQSLSCQLEQRRDEHKPARLYGSMDGFMVLLEEGWREMKAGAWWTTDERLQARNIHYYTDLLPAESFSDLVWTTGFHHRADQALELIFVADAAEWIWRIVEQHFPQAIQIVDWFHACQYLAPVASAAFSPGVNDPAQREAWLESVRTHLWQGRLDDVIAACAQHIQPQLKRDDDPAQQAVTYYTNNRHRMDYPTYRAKGYQIGSGTMESGCKQIGLERLKIAGARWNEDGARKVAKARAALLSREWHHLTPAQQALPQAA